jgi:putative ATP-binding cassette transporter
MAMRDADPTRNATDGLLSLAVENSSTEGQTISGADDYLVKESSLIQSHSINNVGSIKLNLGGMTGSNSILKIDRLKLMTPDNKRTLIENLHLTVLEGENLLIKGSSGAGKSSLLRAIAGLWTSGEGEITRVPDDEVYFLPQRPYCALGSLKDQLLYPSTEALNPDDYPKGHRLSKAHLLRNSLTDQDLLDILTMVDLKDLPYRFGDGDPIKGLNAVVDWSNTLSLGEQQRLAFGRLVVNKPRLVILDESTSALDVVAEAKMYTLLRNMATKQVVGSKLMRAGLTFISVGHRPTLEAYHDTKLVLSGGSKYNIETIEKASTEVKLTAFNPPGL